MRSGGENLVNLTDLSGKQLEAKLREQGVEGELLHSAELDVDGQSGRDIACLIRTPDGQTDAFFITNNETGLKIKKYNEIESAKNDSGWNKYRFANVIQRLRGTFPASPSHQTGLLSRLRDIFLPTIESDPTSDQVKLLKEINDIKDPRFLVPLMGIVSHDLKSGRVYDAFVINEVYNGIVSLIPYLRMEELIKLKGQIEARRLDTQSLHDNRSDEVHKGRAERHMKHIEVIGQELDAEIRYRIQHEYPHVPASDPRYISTHYKSALSGLVETPEKVAEGVVQLLWSGEDPKIITSQFVAGAIYAGWRGVLAVPGELLSIVSGGAFGYNGRDLGAETGNTILAAAPSVKFARSLNAARAHVGRGDFSRPNTGQPIEVVDLTKNKPTLVETPLGPITLPGDTAIPSKSTPGSISAKGGLATYSEVAPDAWIKPFESTDLIDVPKASWLPPPEVIASASEAIPKEPIAFPGMPGAVVTDPKTKDADELIVLPGAMNIAESIGDPNIDLHEIGDIPPAEELRISALSPVENLATAIQHMEKIRHPLTEEGKAFLEKAHTILSDPKASIEEVQNVLNQFPTVEEPQLHYFVDVFEGLPRGALFGMFVDLRTIQVTKGCSHHCTHCAYNTDSHVQRMSYVTVLKIAEALKKVRSSETDAVLEREFKQRGQEIIAELRSGVVNKEKITDHLLTYLGAKGTFKNGYLGASYFRKFWELALYGKQVMTEGTVHASEEFDDEMITISGFETSMETKRRRIGELIDAWILSDENHVLLNGNDLKLKQGWRLDDFMTKTVDIKNRWDDVTNFVTNYADSDPFDFRDPHIRDRNGNMADYGDVVRVMHDLGFRTLIVTAGWDRSDSIAMRSAEKIKQLGISIEISVHPYSAQARRNRDRYRESLKEVIKVLHPHIIFRAYGGEMKQLIKELYAELGVEGPTYFDQIRLWGVSNVGRAQDLQSSTKVDDSYTYHYGIIIEPNGEVVNGSFRTGEAMHTGYNIFSELDWRSYVEPMGQSRENTLEDFKYFAPSEVARDLLERDDERKHDPDYPEFYRRRHQIVAHLLRKDPLDLMELWRELKEKYPNFTFVPSEEYIKLLGTGRSFEPIPTVGWSELKGLIVKAPRDMTRDLLERDDERKLDPDYPEFYRRRREIMTRLSGKDQPDLLELWREIRKKYPDSAFIPTEEYLNLLVTQ